MTARRWRAAGGVVGPVAFVFAWVVLGSGRAGYSPVSDPISRLAAVDASSRAAMTAGFVAFGGGVGAYATALRHYLPGGTAAAAMITAVATAGVAALPLGSPTGDRYHALAVAVAYGALIATPLLGARGFSNHGQPRAARLSAVASTVMAVTLAASAVVPRASGLAQRVGLTVGDAWIVATAAAMLRRR